MISIEELASVFEYDPLTGVIRWKAESASASSGRHVNGKQGGVAGGPHNKGYIRITYRKKHFLAHRLAWALHFGEWPVRLIDHVNRRKTDNRIVNLRSCDVRQNRANSSKDRCPTATSIYKGVSRDPRNGRWRAHCVGNLGMFDSEIAAAVAYDAAALKEYGEFAVPNFPREA